MFTRVVYSFRVTNRILRELVLGLWKIHILHHAATEGVVGNHMLQELREHGYDVSPGTLYPLLRRMLQVGLIRCEEPSCSTHAAHRYVITESGAEILSLLRGYVAELHTELRHEHLAPSKASRPTGGVKEETSEPDAQPQE